MTQPANTSKPRNSNIEWLRIMAIMMVLVSHAGYFTFGPVTCHGLEAAGRVMTEAFALACVNIFMFITGWYGVRFSLEKVLRLCFLALFAMVAAHLVAWAARPDLLVNLACWNPLQYWYVNAYVGLLILAPALNAGVERLTARQLLVVLVLGYLTFGITDFLGLSQGIGTNNGFSILWMAFVYLLGQYCRRHAARPSAPVLWATLLVAYAGQCLVQTHGIAIKAYTCPFALAMAMCWFGLFHRMKPHSSRVVNRMGGAALTVYLLNMTPCLTAWFKLTLHALRQQHGTPAFVALAALYLMTWIIAGVAIDQLRLWLWRLLQPAARRLSTRLQQWAARET